MTDQRILITGSRDWPVHDEGLNKILDTIRMPILRKTQAGDTITFVVGDCPTGVDFLMRNIIHQFPLNRIVKLQVYKAYWSTQGRSAGPKRNKRMVDSGPFDHCYAFITTRQSRSPGTRNCIELAMKAGINVTRTYFK